MRGIIVKETGRRIYDFRKQKGLSADDVAQRAGMHRATYYRYEAGDGKNMKLDKIQAIADALGVRPADLVVWDVEDEKTAPEIGDGLEQKLSRLSPALLGQLDRFLELAQADPETAERFLSFAVQELESSRQWR